VAPAKSNLVKKLIPLMVLIAIAVTAIAYARKQNQPKELVLSGTLEARTVHVGSLVGGRVIRVHVDEGTHVVPQQVLVTLETETLDREITEQQSAVAASRAQLEKTLHGPRDEEIRRAEVIAESDARERVRMKKLFDYGIVARELYESAAAKAKTSALELQMLREGSRSEDIAASRAQLAQQEARVATLQKQRAETVVHSSVGGIVQSFALRPGDLVAPNQSVAEILESDQLWVRVYLPETLLGHARVGMPVKVRIDTFPDQPFPGRIATVASQGEYTPRNVQTRAQRAEQVFGVKVLVDPNPKLKAGMAAEVDLGVKGKAE
jgi:HlyD family secretion protein